MSGGRVLARHEVIHPDGRQFLLYGDVDDATLAALAAQPADSGHDPSLLHRRYDRLTDAWVLVSPARNVRPSTTTTGEGAPPCPLCPGGPELPGPFGLAVFENRYPSMSPHAPEPGGVGSGRPRGRSSLGRCLVVVYTDEHVEHLADLDAAAVRRRRRRLARPHDGAVGGGPRLRDGLREPRQRRRRHAAPPPRPALRLRPPSAGDGDEAGQPRPAPPAPRRLPRLPARRRGPRQRPGDPRQRALRRRRPVRLPVAAGGPRPRPPTTASAGSATSPTTPPSTSSAPCPTSCAATTGCGGSPCRT